MDISGYKVLSFIGRGAGSTIHKVRDIRTGAVLAMKRVTSESDPEGRFREQIDNEYRTGRNVTHANVVRMHNLERVRRMLRVVEMRLFMDYEEGPTLEQAAVSEPAELARLFVGVAEGLQAIHRAGFVHGDIKPSNLIRRPGGTICIVDLGQSCPIGRSKKRIQGTPDFIAPEQVLKLPLDPRTDVFNVGTTMYWCLTGRTFPTRLKSKRSAASFNVDAREEVESPVECNPAVPTVFSNLVMDCCRNTPLHRPADMAAVLEGLRSVERVLERRPVDP